MSAILPFNQKSFVVMDEEIVKRLETIDVKNYGDRHYLHVPLPSNGRERAPLEMGKTSLPIA